jgi:hypothetical protein
MTRARERGARPLATRTGAQNVSISQNDARATCP